MSNLYRSNGSIFSPLKIDLASINATTFPPSIHTHTVLKSDTNYRDIATIPNDYNGYFDIKGLKRNAVLGIAGAGDYSGVLGMRPWGDATGGYAHEFALTGGADGTIKHRVGDTTTWRIWKTLAYQEDHYTQTEVDSKLGEKLNKKSNLNELYQYRNIGSQYFASASNIGAVSIDLGTANVMLNMRITIRSYNFLAELMVGGYTYTSTSGWHLPQCFGNVQGGTLNVRFRNDGSRRYISIGETTTDWSGYLHISIDEINVGYGGNNLQTPVSISLVTSYPGTTQTEAYTLDALSKLSELNDSFQERLGNLKIVTILHSVYTNPSFSPDEDTLYIVLEG